MRAFDGVGGCDTVHQVGKWTCDQRVTLMWLTLLCPRARRLTRFAREKMDQWISYVRTLWSSVECVPVLVMLLRFLFRLMLREEPPSAPPKNIVASGRTNQSIMVQWQPPPEPQLNGVLRGYILRWDIHKLFHRQNFTDEMCRNMNMNPGTSTILWIQSKVLYRVMFFHWMVILDWFYVFLLFL